MENAVNVQTIMQEIRERIRARSAAPRVPAQPVFSPAIEPPRLSALESAVRSLDAAKSLAGEMPPQPPSLRGWLGGVLVRIVRRMLFWYTPQIHQFQAGVVAAFNTQLDVLRTLSAGDQQNAGLLLDVQQGVEKLEQALRPEMRAREQLADRLEAECAKREAVERTLAAQARASEQFEQLAQKLDAEVAAREQLVAKAHQMTEKVRQADTAIQSLRAEISHQTARISILLEEVRKSSGAVSSPFEPRLAEEDRHKLDALYAAFEQRFRGTQADIAERFRGYLPRLQERQVGTPAMAILDLGCGRGEWLGMLSEAGLEAYGVDTNRVFVAACRERGLRVSEEDVLEHLRRLPDARLGAVTGFHLIEHLPLDILIKLIDETVRVLKPGGLAIFETPNPQNVLVGAHNFWLDPTHIHPIPCVAAEFLLEARGLCNIEIVQLHPYADSYLLNGETELAQRFNDYFYGPQDYAVIGYRV